MPVSENDRRADRVLVAVAIAALLAVMTAAAVFASSTPTRGAPPNTVVPLEERPEVYDVLCFKPRLREHPACLRSGGTPADLPVGFTR